MDGSANGDVHDGAVVLEPVSVSGDMIMVIGWLVVVVVVFFSINNGGITCNAEQGENVWKKHNKNAPTNQTTKNGQQYIQHTRLARAGCNDVLVMQVWIQSPHYIHLPCTCRARIQ